jgi:hypothetical protein
MGSDCPYNEFLGAPRAGDHSAGVAAGSMQRERERERGRADTSDGSSGIRNVRVMLRAFNLLSVATLSVK